LRIAVEAAPWETSRTAAHCFSAFPNDADAWDYFNEFLKSYHAKDVQRVVIDAIGQIGFDGNPSTMMKLARRDEELRHQAIIALLRIFGRVASNNYLSLVEDLVSVGDENPSPYKKFEPNWSVITHDVIGYLTNRNADKLITKWLPHENPVYRRFAVDALQWLRLKRTVDPLIARLFDNRESPDVRRGAGIALGDIVCLESASALATEIRNGGSGPGVDYAFSTLYPLPIDWSGCEHIADAIIAQRDTVPRDQLLYAVGLRKDRRHIGSIEAGLCATDPEVRGMSAIALSRLLGTEAAPILAGRDREASTADEAAFFLTAQIVAGDHSRGLDLDIALQRWGEGGPFVRLNRCWKREILCALSIADGCAQRAELWAELGADDLTRCRADLSLTLQSIKENTL
jgi:HEAT repeat protein